MIPPLPTFNDDVSDNVALDLLVAHSCATENKWKETKNDMTYEQMFKDILVKVRQAGYTAHHNRHFLTLKCFQTTRKPTIIQMLLYQWGNIIRSAVEQVVDLQAAGIGGDFDDITVL